MNEYAKVSGRGSEPHPHPSPPLEGEGMRWASPPLEGEGRKKKPVRELSEAEKEAVACTKTRVELHMPEMVPFIKELHEAGMIDGWRNVTDFRFKEGTE